VVVYGQKLSAIFEEDESQFISIKPEISIFGLVLATRKYIQIIKPTGTTDSY
jgi:hypothetical protein